MLRHPRDEAQGWVVEFFIDSESRSRKGASAYVEPQEAAAIMNFLGLYTLNCRHGTGASNSHSTPPHCHHRDVLELSLRFIAGFVL